jgi:hypothetical protein
MVHRMDMVWIDFRPDEGVIRATGHGRSFAASKVRGLGLVMEYDSIVQRSLSIPQIRVPSPDADKVCVMSLSTLDVFAHYYQMACGILPGFRHRFGVGNIYVPAVSDLYLRTSHAIPVMS